MKGRKLKANEPILLIQVKIACNTGLPRTGIRVMTSWLLRELPMPSIMPQNDNNATGNMKVLPNCWKNSHSVTFGAVFAVIKRLLVENNLDSVNCARR